MYLISEPSVLEMIPFNISLSPEDSISDDNFFVTVWRTSKSAVYEMYLGSVLEMALFKVRSGSDILKLSSMWNISI